MVLEKIKETMQEYYVPAMVGVAIASLLLMMAAGAFAGLSVTLLSFLVGFLVYSYVRS